MHDQRTYHAGTSTSTSQKIPVRPSRRLLSLKEAAIYLGRSVYSTRSLVYDHLIPVVKHGTKQWVDIVDLDNYIDTHKALA